MNQRLNFHVPAVVKSLSGGVRNVEPLADPINVPNVGSQALKRGYLMADILASIKILPSEAQIDLAKLKTDIQQVVPEKVKIQKFQEEPIAFGLVALIAHVTMPEKEEGVMSRLEEVLLSVSGVGEIQVIGMTRI